MRRSSAGQWWCKAPHPPPPTSLLQEGPDGHQSRTHSHVTWLDCSSADLYALQMQHGCQSSSGHFPPVCSGNDCTRVLSQVDHAMKKAAYLFCQANSPPCSASDKQLNRSPPAMKLVINIVLESLTQTPRNRRIFSARSFFMKATCMKPCMVMTTKVLKACQKGIHVLNTGRRSGHPD